MTTDAPSSVLTDRSRIEQVARLEPLSRVNIHVIGAGVTGGPLTRLLAKQGLAASGQLHVWDPDSVGPENLCNQVYRPDHVGQPKVEALADIVASETGGHQLTVHHEAVDETTILDGVVFTMLDSMAVRAEVWEGCIKHNPHVRMLLDVRLAVGEYHLLSFYPDDEEAWKTFWYPDPVIAQNACRDVTNMNSTAYAAAGTAVDWFWFWVQLDLCFENLDPLPYRAVFPVHPTNVFVNRRGD